MSRRFVAWAAVAALLGVALGCNKEKPAEPTGRASGSSGGEVKVTPVKFDGLEKAIAEAKGKVVLIDFWATWCPPCVDSFPHLVEKHQKYADKGLAVFSVSLDDPDEATAVIEFLRQNQATFTNLHLDVDGPGRTGLTEKFAFKGSIPHAVLIDRQGNRAWAGHPMENDLQDRIEAELAKK